MTLDLSLLGETTISLDGNPLNYLSAEKDFALLIYLIVESDRAHRREALAEMFWPNKPEGYGRNSLKQALSQLRTYLNDRENPDPFLISSKRDLQFNIQSPFQLDVFVFEELINKTRKHCPDDQPCCGDCRTFLEKVAGLYRGDFLSDFYLPDSSVFDEWILAKREAYRQLQVRTLTRLITTLEAAGDFAGASGYAESLVALEPWSESSHRALMTLLAKSGRRSAALKQYHACKKMLAGEFGVEPTPQTQQLYGEIKAWDQKRGWKAAVEAGKTDPARSSSSETKPPAGLRKWVIFSASLSILILTGVLYILFRPDRSGPPNLTESQSINLENKAGGSLTSSEEPPLQATITLSPQDPSADQPDRSTSEPFFIPSDPEGIYAIAPEEACLPGEELLYLEDFQDGHAQGWQEVEYQAQEWSIEPDPLNPGNLVLTRPSTFDGGSDLRGKEFGNAVFRLKVMFPAAAISNITWQWNDKPYQTEQGEVDYSAYDVWIHFPDIRTTRTASPLSEIELRWENEILKVNTWHLLEISAYQGLYVVRVDGKKLVEYHDPEPLPPGRIAIGVGLGGEPINHTPVYFDDLVVCGLSAPFVSAYDQ